MDARLRRLLRDAKHDPLLREAAKAEMARSGWCRQAMIDSTFKTLHRAFVDLLDYRGLRLSATSPEAGWLFVGTAPGHTTTVRVYFPSDDEVLDTCGALDLRFVVGAPVHERSLVIETVEEAFPGCVVMSSMAADGKKPPRREDLKPIDDEAAKMLPVLSEGWIP